VIRISIALLLFIVLSAPVQAAESHSGEAQRLGDARQSSGVARADVPQQMVSPHIPPPVQVNDPFESSSVLTPVEQSHQELQASPFGIEDKNATAKRKKALNKEEQKAKSAQQNANKVVSEIKKQNEADVEKRKKEISQANDARVQGFVPLEKQAIQPPHRVGMTPMVQAKPSTGRGVEAREAIEKNDAWVKKQTAWKAKPWQPTRQATEVSKEKTP
jgi:hypothetical protein